ncbi:MAG: hypothetical protein ACTSRW_04840 [Candidatus Helarchaeota archaeon]
MKSVNEKKENKRNEDINEDLKPFEEIWTNISPEESSSTMNEWTDAQVWAKKIIQLCEEHA